MLKAGLISVAVLAASAGGCGIGEGSGSAQGPLWILGCRDGDPLGTPDKPMGFDLKPTFFAGEPIEDIAGIPPSNRLIISMRRNGNSVEINDTLYFDIRNSAQIARCIRGRTVNGVPDWDTSSGMLAPDGTVATVPPALPWCMQPATMDGLPQIRLVPFGPVAVSFAPLATCHVSDSAMHPPAIVAVNGVANDGYITFSNFGSAVQSDRSRRTLRPTRAKRSTTTSRSPTTSSCRRRSSSPSRTSVSRPRCGTWWCRHRPPSSAACSAATSPSI